MLKIYRNLREAQSSVEKLLMVPSIEYEETSGTLTITQVSNWILDTWWCHSLCVIFLQELSGSGDPNTQLSFIREMDNSTRRGLRSTIFNSEAAEAYIAYCQLLYISLHLGLFGTRQPHPGSHMWSNFTFWAEVLASSFFNSQVFNLIIFLFLSKQNRG